ncbi:paired small multidrug resistance pump [Pullulanibacillus pueri]|uniref:QacE family quaternary ammonium compound efflux SMR transporter n=1 Tax=Pullulanibacillus pueri TaxID=1437324 RepID=A0A8J3EMH0_9BACL|nr:SMR family transporter [Pullulanibacillus pueri]MBM7682666.1 paired small multidrug resistance pump [Pullulanibacillus pueri]GGH82712.1 QacE family quaternary ammonium compound efflux SMR transporter [Pullulanibacillus pueri]
MSWVYLFLAGLIEVVGVVGLKKVSEKSSWLSYVILIGGFIISLSLLRMSLEQISLSVAYAVWTGIGTVGATVIGILFYRESKSPFRIACIFGIIVTIIGLRLVG